VGAGDLWRLLPLQRLRVLRLPMGSSEGEPALACLALLSALGRVEYAGGGCWSGCDIRREVAAAAAGADVGAAVQP
jgi:hypothetical protein